MAAGDLYIVQERIYKRETDGTWSEVTAMGIRTGAQAATFSQDGELIVARGTTSQPRLNTWRNGAWVRTDLDGSARPGVPQGLGIDADGKIYAGLSTRIYTVETNYPYVTPDPVPDPLSDQDLTGLSVDQHTGKIAYCSPAKVYERELDATHWTDITPPSSVVSGSTFYQSLAHGLDSDLWVYSLIQQRFYVRDNDGNWASGIQVPTTIGSRRVGRTGILATAIDQGVVAVRNLHLGSQAIDALYLGSDSVDALYLGETKVWE